MGLVPSNLLGNLSNEKGLFIGILTIPGSSAYSRSEQLKKVFVIPDFHIKTNQLKVIGPRS